MLQENNAKCFSPVWMVPLAGLVSSVMAAKSVSYICINNSDFIRK